MFSWLGKQTVRADPRFSTWPNVSISKGGGKVKKEKIPLLDYRPLSSDNDGWQEYR